MSTKKTPEERKEFQTMLRHMWKTAKELTEKEGNSVQAVIDTLGIEASPISFILVRSQMRAQGLEGTPYIDMKTFQGWIENGFKVKKGEKAKAYGITWVAVKSKDEDNKVMSEDDYMYPKAYYLFHKDQVEPIE